MNKERVSIPVGEGESVSGVITSPVECHRGKSAGVILAHGAANDMDNPLIVAMAEGLADTGFITLRFNFLYKEKGERKKDPQETLVRTWRRVFDYFKNNSGCSPDRIVAMGKSMGGRVASQMVADGALPVERLVFLGYPLHSPGRKDRLRDAHLYHIKIPMLFFTGTRDPFCDLGQLNIVLNKLNCHWDLEIVEGGDHSLDPPGKVAADQRAIYDEVLSKSRIWLGA